MEPWPSGLSPWNSCVTPFDGWTFKAACLGNLITGGVGSGKTTGPFQYVIRSLLRAGCGGISLCAKKDAITDYRKHVESEGREQDLIVFRHSEQCFSSLSYEANRGGEGHAAIDNPVSLILQAAEITARNSGLAEQVYPELRLMARRYLKNKLQSNTPQPAALVNEVFLRLVDVTKVEWHESAQFTAMVAQTMRRILVDAARARGPAHSAEIENAGART